MIRTLHGQLVDECRREFRERHLEATVSDDRPDLLVGVPELRADRGREAESHRARAAAADPMSIGAGSTELRGPHLVLAHVRRDDRLALGERVEPVEHVLSPQASLLRVLEGVEAAPLFALLQPIGGIRHLDLGNQVFDHEPRVAEDRHVRPARSC